MGPFLFADFAGFPLGGVHNVMLIQVFANENVTCIVLSSLAVYEEAIDLFHRGSLVRFVRPATHCIISRPRLDSSRPVPCSFLFSSAFTPCNSYLYNTRARRGLINKGRVTCTERSARQGSQPGRFRGFPSITVWQLRRYFDPARRGTPWIIPMFPWRIHMQSEVLAAVVRNNA